jgi:SAM-dependent methyltransferase
LETTLAVATGTMTLEERGAGGPAFDWPPLHGLSPIWTGRGFLVGGEARAMLDYEAGESGWSEELTRFHEEAAGEGTHPIDVASRQRARAALRRHVRADRGEVVLLEIGCSSGFLVQELIGDWPEGLVIGSDYIAGPLRRLATRLPNLPLLRFDLIKCPLPSASVDAAVLLNVLEHIEDDEAAVGQVARILKPGGVAVVEVPAGPRLYDAYDKYLRHYRRYELEQVSRLLERAGLTVVTGSHLGCLLYPAFAFVKRRNQRWLAAPEQIQRAVVERNIRRSGQGPLLRFTTAIEEWLARWVSFPVGIRCVAVAMKQGRR